MKCFYEDCNNEAMIEDIFCEECNNLVEQEEAEKVAECIEAGAFEVQDLIYCPYCGEILNEYINEDDIEFSEEILNCSLCNNDFRLETETITVYSTYVMED